jgi:uncharacterized linocin/CFP29 family protein
MAGKYLAREDAPFGEDVWSAIDNIVVSAAKSQLSGRRLLDIEGPYGLGLKAIPLSDEVAVEGDVRVASSPVLPVPVIETEFALAVRDLANYEETGFSLDTAAIAQAAMALAAMEDTLIFEGNKALGIDGLLTAKGVQAVTLGKWDEVGAAANDIIKAVTALDSAGFHGPYALALAPDLHNLLFRRYPQGNQTEMQHIEGIVGSSVIKAPAIKKGGVLIATGRQFASIVIGQDMATAFIGPDDSEFEFRISESLTPRIRVPGSVCVLKG